MRELRNPAYRREWITYAVLTALSGALGFFVSAHCGGLLLLCGCLFMALHLHFTRRRYMEIAALSREINAILHGQDRLMIAGCDEGELSILRSEVQKMTLRLKENADALLSDKRVLTRAMEDIFHQLCTPLTAMNLEVSLLAAEEISYTRRLSLVRELRGQLEHVDWLVETLLKMSQLDADAVTLRREPLPLRQVVEKAAAPLAIPMELREQRLQTELGDACFSGDLSWTAEAIGNILKNCMEHTPAGGVISLAAEETPLFTQLLIRDSGPGFDPADLPRLFERFYRGRSVGSGSIGIGLALSRLVIAAQNGTVTADNPPGGGARFIIRFYKSVI